jgi:DNA invertase Pin-like site-specific DNA recombinase
MSTHGQEASIPEQREWARKACQHERLDLVQEFADHGIPGSEIEGRTDLLRLIEFCEQRAAAKRPIHAVVVWDPDRFSRASSIRTAALLDRLMQAGVSRLLTADGWIDLEEDTDVLLFHIKQDFSRAGFSKSLSKSIARDGSDRAAKGWHVAGRPPYGYKPRMVLKVVNGKERLSPEKLEFDDERKVETVKWLFATYASSSSCSLGDLVRLLTEQGAPPPPTRRKRGEDTPRPGKWTRPTVWAILTNVVYTGTKQWNLHHQGKYHHVSKGVVKARRTGGKNQWCKADPQDVVTVENAHPAIVDKALFEAVQRKLAASRWKRTTPQAGGGEWVLSGLVHCGQCGGRMVGHTQHHKRKGKTYTYKKYVCRGNFRHGPGTCGACAAEQDTLVREVARIIKQAFTDPTRLEMLRKEIETQAAQGDVEVAKQRQRLAERVATLERDIAQGQARLLKIPDDQMAGVLGVLRAMQAEHVEAVRELDRLDAVAQAGADYAGVVAVALEELQRLEECLAEATPAEARDLLGRWVDKVTLHFHPGEPLAGGRFASRQRHVLADIEIEFSEAASHLLPTGTKKQQVKLVYKGGVLSVVAA